MVSSSVGAATGRLIAMSASWFCFWRSIMKTAICSWFFCIICMLCIWFVCII